MDLQTLEQKLVFLDTAHQRSRVDMDTLRARAAEQANTLTELRQQFTGLFDDVARTQARLAAFDQVDKAMQNMRAELTGLIEEQKTRLTAEAERGRAQHAAVLEQTESLSKRIQSLTDTASQALRQTGDLKAVDAVQAERLTLVADTVQELIDTVHTGQTSVERLHTRVDTHGEEAANLYRLVQGLEERMTGAQTLAGELRERLNRQTEAMTELGRMLQAVRADLTSTQAQLVKFPQIEEALSQAKDELTVLVRGFREQQQAELDRAAHERREERRVMAVGLAEVQKQLEVFPPIYERLTQNERETTRLNTLLAQVDAKLDALGSEMTERTDPLPYIDQQIEKHASRLAVLERDVVEIDSKYNQKVAPIPLLDKSLLALTRRIELVEADQPKHVQRMNAHQSSLAYLEEQRDSHTDRLDLIEARLPGFDRADIEVREKVDFLEDWSQRVATRLDELQRFEDDLRRSVAELVEGEKVRDTHREQRMAAWAVVLAEHQVQLQKWEKVLQRYEDHHLGVTRQMQEMRDLGQELGHHQRVSIENQRIEAEKIRREVAEWQTDVDKRWALFFKQRDWDWKEQKVVNAGILDHLKRIDGQLVKEAQTTVEIAQRLEAKDRDLLLRIEDLWEVHEADARQRVEAVKGWLAEVQESKTKTPKPRVPKPGEKIIGTDPRYRNG